MRPIDADALKNAFEEDGHMSGYIEEFIDDMPTLDVVPVVHGRWIEYTKVIIPEPYNKWEQAWKCSECGFDEGFVGYGYCPNCGAIMDLED